MTDMAEVLPMLQENVRRNNVRSGATARNGIHLDNNTTTEATANSDSTSNSGDCAGCDLGSIVVSQLDWEDADALHEMKHRKRWDAIVATDVLYSPTVIALFHKALMAICEPDDVILVGYRKRADEETDHIAAVYSTFDVDVVATLGEVRIYLWKKKSEKPIASYDSTSTST
jgi:predicted nicotinamide N-methyase